MVKRICGIVPMDADVLMIGVVPDHFDHYQRMVKGGFQSMHMGWSYVANLGKTMDYVIKEFLPKRPDLDVIYICNQVNRPVAELRADAAKLIQALAGLKFEMQPWIALDEDVAFLEPIFLAGGVTTLRSSIEIVAGERHSQKRRMADLEPEPA